MTREEAITRLHWLKRELIKGTDMNEPIDMAISALQEPLGLCEHCIWNDCNYNKLDYEAPYAQTEAVQGEWDCMIADGSDGSHWYEYECSHCGEVVLRPWDFCPNCGAKMTKGGEDK